MSKRNVERREAKGAGRKRRTTRDLPARKGLRVTGGLLPALQATRERARGGDDIPLEEIAFAYGKL